MGDARWNQHFVESGTIGSHALSEIKHNRRAVMSGKESPFVFTHG